MALARSTVFSLDPLVASILEFLLTEKPEQKNSEEQKKQQQEHALQKKYLSSVDKRFHNIVRAIPQNVLGNNPDPFSEIKAMEPYQRYHLEIEDNLYRKWQEEHRKIEPSQLTAVLGFLCCIGLPTILTIFSLISGLVFLPQNRDRYNAPIADGDATTCVDVTNGRFNHTLISNSTIEHCYNLLSLVNFDINSTIGCAIPAGTLAAIAIVYGLCFCCQNRKLADEYRPFIERAKAGQSLYARHARTIVVPDEKPGEVVTVDISEDASGMMRESLLPTNSKPKGSWCNIL